MIGADPEFFLINSETGLKSSIGLIGGSKEHPAPIGRDGFFVQEDNVAVEINIPPAATADAFIESLTWAKTRVSEAIASLNLKIYIESWAVFPPEELATPRAQVFGCDPDYSVWTNGKPNSKPVSANPALRTCGGHVHFGWDNPDRELRMRLGRMCDLYLGVPSVLMDNKGAKRQELYGKAGACRFPKYGLEYRVLSNFWLEDEKRMRWVYDQAQTAFSLAQDDAAMEQLMKDQSRIVDAINGYDCGLASDLCRDYSIVRI